MPPLRGGICMGVYLKIHLFAPGLPAGRRHPAHRLPGRDCHCCHSPGSLPSEKGTTEKVLRNFARKPMLESGGVHTPEPQFYITESVHDVVLQKSIPAQNRQLILYYY
jgi:hypothetical protein